MNHLIIFLFIMIFAFDSEGVINSDRMSINYQIMSADIFHQMVAGNTVIGKTPNTSSLYMLYFGLDGECRLWKQKKIFEGNWWIEQDELGRDFVRAYWPEHYRSATRVWYYYCPEQPEMMLLRTKTLQEPVLLMPGCPFAE